MPYYYNAPPIPKAFIWRRFHSLTGLWLVLFLIEHLLTNSQAALYIGDDGSGFIRAVNFLKDLPYLQAIEVTLIGIPLVIHGWWGIKYLHTAKYNSFSSDGTTPSLPEYPRNRAYTWQRITSWILLVGIIAHVVQMRFVEYPTPIQVDNHHYYTVSLTQDAGLSSLAERLDVKLTADQNQVTALSPNFGTAVLLMVRETFKSPLMIFLYTVFVLAATFHAFNGLWTFMITWGITLTTASQRLMRKCAVVLMVLISFLGLAAIWATYWINLKS
jgi:succinate dehydrogenase / fumarate reductase cytochrome b subunit